MALKRWAIPALPLTSLVDGVSDLWTASTSGTAEYYYNGTLDQWGAPLRLLIDGTLTAISANAPGALAAGEWAWGDNDTLGTNTIYIRLADDTDPDTKAADHIQASQPVVLMEAQTAEETVLFSLLLSNYGVVDASIEVRHTDTDGLTSIFEWIIDKALGESPTAIDSPIVLEPGDKIFVKSNQADVSVLASGEAK